jgi:hypothetical protein
MGDSSVDPTPPEAAAVTWDTSASQPLAPGAILLADRGVKPGVHGKYPAPPSPAQEPRGTRAPSLEQVTAAQMEDAQKAVSALLEERQKLPGVDPAKAAQLQKAISLLAISAKKGADANFKAQNDAYDKVLSAAKLGVTVDVAELAQNLDDAIRLRHLAADIPPEEIAPGIAQIADMPARAELRRLCVKTMAMLDPNWHPKLKPKLMQEIKVIENRAIGFADTAETKWLAAKNASKNGSASEAKASADGYTHAQEFKKMVQKQVKITNQVLEKFASAGSAAAKAAQQQFHEEAEELLRIAAANLQRLASESGKEIANDDRRKANAEADDEKRGQKRSTQQASERQDALHKRQQAEANTAAADERYAQRQTRIAAEVAKPDGTPPPRKFG